MKHCALLSTIPGLVSLLVHGFSPAPRPSISTPPRRAASAIDRRPHPREHNRPLAFAPPPPRLLSSAPAGGDGTVGDAEPFIRPAVHNTPLFRSLTVLSALLFAFAPTNALHRIGRHVVLPPKAAASVHLLSFGTWFGSMVYTTFIAGIAMFKNLPRRVFGTLQSKLFPMYFRLCTLMIVVQFLTLTAMPDVLGKVSEVSLAVAFLTTLLNLLYLEPASTSVMFDRYSLEDDGRREGEESSKLAKSFGKLHGMSSLANLVALCGGVIDGVRLASVLAA